MAHPASPSTDPGGLLDHVDRLRAHTRADLRSFWFPLVLFGLLTLISAPMAGGAGVAIFWAIAGPLGGMATGTYYHFRGQRVGVFRPPLPFVLTAVGLLAGAFLLPAVTTGRLQEVVSTFAVAAAYLAFARLDRSYFLVGVSIGLAVVPLAALASDIDHPGSITAAATGAVLLVTGLVSLALEHQAR